MCIGIGKNVRPVMQMDNAMFVARVARQAGVTACLRVSCNDAIANVELSPKKVIFLRRILLLSQFINEIWSNCVEFGSDASVEYQCTGCLPCCDVGCDTVFKQDLIQLSLETQCVCRHRT